MGNFWLGFVAALFLVWFTHKVYELLKQKLGGNRWYRVVDVQPSSMPGYWNVEFYAGGSSCIRLLQKTAAARGQSAGTDGTHQAF